MPGIEQIAAALRVEHREQALAHQPIVVAALAADRLVEQVEPFVDRVRVEQVVGRALLGVGERLVRFGQLVELLAVAGLRVVGVEALGEMAVDPLIVAASARGLTWSTS